MVKKTEYDKLVKTFNANQTTDDSYLVKITDFDTKLMKLKKSLIVIMRNILIHKNLINLGQINLMQDQNRQN